MPESQTCLFVGDPYRIERTLATRHEAILAVHPETERIPLFGDELDISSFRIDLHSESLFSTTRHFIIRRVEEIKAAKTFNNVLDTSFPPNTYLTLLATTLTLSHPIAKRVEESGQVKRLPKLKRPYVNRATSEIFGNIGLQLTPDALEALMMRSGGDLLTLLQEARKLYAYAPEGPINQIMIDSLAFTTGEGSIYPFLDRVGEGHLHAALHVLGELHENAGRVLSAGLRHWTRILMVRVLIDAETPFVNIATALGTPSWLVKKYFRQAKAHTASSMIEILKEGIALDSAVKTGKIRAEDALLRWILFATRPLSKHAQVGSRKIPPSRARAY